LAIATGAPGSKVCEQLGAAEVAVFKSHTQGKPSLLPGSSSEAGARASKPSFQSTRKVVGGRLFLFPPFAVEGFVDLAQVFVGNVGIHLGGGYVGMSKHRLYRAQVSTVF